MMRLSKVASELNVGVYTIVDFLYLNGFKIDGRPNTKITSKMY
jgi:translation initiation factor IF-2